MNGGARELDIYIICISLSLSSKYIYRQTGVSHLVPRWELIKPKGEKMEKDTPGQQPNNPANCQKSNRMKNGGDGADRQES